MLRKMFTVLENNPEVMKALAEKLGLSRDLAFYDVYSLEEDDLSYRSRPAFALLAIIPLTEAWRRDREREDAAGIGEDYHQQPADGNSNNSNKAPVIWFKQTIGDACGSIGLLHCVVNGAATDYILPGSTIEKLRNDAIPLAMAERAQMLYDSQAFEEAHQSVAKMGDTEAPEQHSIVHHGRHFVAFVKVDGHLWELEGSRKGPIDRGELGPDEDVLSPKALDLGLKRIIKLEHESGGGDLHFSCIALADDNNW